MTPQPSAWYRLRASRAHPPGIPTKDKNGVALYRSALQQAEELSRAAEAAGHASRPLPLYYSLTQAGRAIVAVRGADSRLIANDHGLTFHSNPPPAILNSHVGPKERGQFPLVSAATGSMSPSKVVELGALMASIPELATLPELGSRWLRALPVWPHVLTTPFDRAAYDGYAPAHVVLPAIPTSTGDVRTALDPYALNGELFFRNVAGLPPGYVFSAQTPDGVGVEVLWRIPADGSDPRPGRYGPDGRRWLRPPLCGDALPPTLLMTWWALLFGLSMLARYHPVEWTSALNQDISEVALPLEYALTVALEVIPELVLKALEA